MRGNLLDMKMGELCFGGGWFIVGVDTPEGNYTYHYETDFYSLFDCEELERAKYWDVHTEQHVTRLLSLPSAPPKRKPGRWIKISPAGIYECSECGKTVMTADIDTYDFCHGCGRKMVVEHYDNNEEEE